MDYLAAALEQEEPEEKELRVELDLREPLLGPVGENADGKTSPSAVSGKTGEVGIETDAPLRERGRAADGLEKFLRRRSEVTGLARLAQSARNGDVAPLTGARTGAEAEWDAPLGRRGRELPVSLAAALRKARTGADFVRRERRNLTVTLPEAPAVAGSFSAEELDRAVERDARRYDGGFSLY